MTIGLQGTWHVSVASKSAAWPQRFVIAGADSGNDTYDVTDAPLVTGTQWGVTIEHDPSGPTGWRPSRMRLANYRVEGGFFKVDVESDDGGGGDEDFDDLVLTLSKPLSGDEWIVYGTAKSYTGFCLFNPCFPYPWVVVDTAAQLDRLLRFEKVRPVLERAYGADISAKRHADRFTPLMLSRGGSSRGGLSVTGTTRVDAQERAAAGRALTAAVEAELRAAASPAVRADLTAADLGVLRPLFRRPCESEPIAQALMRFVEYDRTDDELGGAAYTGFGDRETLGVTATDEFGNYVFSFTRSTAQIAEEVVGDTPPGDDPAVAGRPDLMIQFVAEPDGVAVHETAPYYDIPNVRRIDLCIRADRLAPKPCRGDRVIQYLGDIPIVANPGSTLHADGTITNTSASESGPHITRGAWRGVLDIFGCFEDTTPTVKHYTLEYRVDDGSWNYLAIDASGLRNPGDGTWLPESYGATPTALSVGTVPAYRNIEEETGWSLEAEHRKARVNLDALIGADPDRVATVRFRIRGYDSTGAYVPNTTDTVKLLVDDAPAVGEIESVVVPGGTDPGECALLELPSDTTPLEFRLRATDEAGFLDSWSLTAVRGSSTAVGLTDEAAGGAPGGTYPGPDPVTNRYHGTLERPTADPDGFVTLSVGPPPSGWLGDETFCAYSFELFVRDRTTNGKTVAATRRVWDEVVGMHREESD